MEKLLSKRTHNTIIKRFVTAIMMAALLLTGTVFGNSTLTVQAAAEYTTLYFVDNTAEQWVKNNDAVMVLVDNTQGHTEYEMGQLNSTTWSVQVPASANNITFNRYDSERTTLWNSWSAGGRDGKNAYFCEGHEFGAWGILNQEITSGNYRIELKWGATPRDLDTHLSYYENGVRKMFVNYTNKVGYIDGQKVAELDVDDRNGYGQETITMDIDAELLQNGGVFKYSIQNYTDRFSTDSKALSMSDAVVSVYKGNDLIATYFVPEDEEGTVWHVFQITKDGIVPVNEMEYNSSVTNVN